MCEGWKAEELPLCALADDRVVEVQGDPRNVQRAMELVVSHLRKFLVDRSVLPLFELNVSYHDSNFLIKFMWKGID